MNVCKKESFDRVATITGQDFDTPGRPTQIHASGLHYVDFLMTVKTHAMPPASKSAKPEAQGQSWNEKFRFVLFNLHHFQWCTTFSGGGAPLSPVVLALTCVLEPPLVRGHLLR